VLALARKEADRFNHNYVGTEHLLLGLIKLGQGVAVNVLTKLGVDLDSVRLQVEQQTSGGPDTKMVGNIPYTPRVKKVLALASKEAKALNHSYPTWAPSTCCSACCAKVRAWPPRCCASST
jgi:ATP-dependent Clp protease ATP-binding subunit ClpC